jgi:hypothetical protein
MLLILTGELFAIETGSLPSKLEDSLQVFDAT